MKLRLTDGSEVVLPDSKREAGQYLADLIRSGGRVPGKSQNLDWQTFVESALKPRDAVTASEIRPFLQASMEIILREPVEPLMTITPLFTRIMAKGLDTRILVGAMGAVTAGDVQEGQTYPEVNFQVGSGMQVAQIGKSGIAASFTDEALRYSTWDIMAMNLNLMRKALIRHKEQKAVSFLKELGVELFNNVTPATSAFGVCTGRGLDMAANGSPTMDDLFKGMAFMNEEGFPADTLLINPLFFYLWLQDPVLRNMMLAHGGGAYFQKWGGQAGPLDPWSNGSMGAQGPTRGNTIVPGGTPSGETPTGVEGREHGMTATPAIPGYFPWPFQILVSPLVPYDPETQLGDIFMLSSGNVGFLLVDEDPVQVEWRDEVDETVKVKIRERYAFAVANEGQGVGVMKNVKLARNYWDGTVKAATLDVDEEIAADADLSAVL